MAVRLRDIPVRAATGSLIGIAVAYAGGLLPFPGAGLAIVAPMGASAVLAFAVPASPLATPRAIILGNTLSAGIGVGISLLPGLPDALACGLAVALAIVGMALTRSLHPPGGASALTAVLLHPAARDLGQGLLFPLFPVALNSILLTVAAMLYHRCTGHAYPHQPVPVVPVPRAGYFVREDMYAALRQMPDALDVDAADLERLLRLTEQAAEQRHRMSGV